MPILRHTSSAPLLTAVVALVAVVACGRPARENRSSAVPGDLAALNNRGVGLMGRYEFGEARAVFDEAARRAPGRLDLQVNLAIATLNRQREGDDVLAQAILERVLAAEPRHVRAHYCLGLLLLNAGKPKEALAHFTFAATERDADAYAAYYVAQCAFQLGEFAEALHWYERAARLDPRLQSAVYGMFNTLQRLGRTVEAQKSMQTFQDLADNPQSRTVEFKYTRMGPLGEAATIDSPPQVLPTPPTGPVFADTETPLVSVPLPTGWRWHRRDTQRPASITAADIDGDGRIDLFVAGALERAGRSGNAVLFNRGEAGFLLDTAHPLAAAADVDAALWGDYDNDGLTDVYLCRRGSNQLWRQTSTGHWADVTVATRTSGPGGHTVDGAMFDADHDGDLDLFLVSADGPNELLNNNGDGTFQPLARQIGLAGDGRPSTGVVVADLDGDRDLDLIVLKAQPPHDVFFNDRVWRYQRAPGFGQFVQSPIRAAVAADLDADGGVELYSSGDQGLARWTRDRAGSWSAEHLANTAPLAASAQMAVADVDGDGRLEILAADADNRWHAVRVAPGRASETIAHASGPALAGWTPAVLDPAKGPAIVSLRSQPEAAPGIWKPGPGRWPFAALIFTGLDRKGDQMRSNASGIGATVAARADSRWTALTSLRDASGPGQSLQPLAIGSGGAPQLDFVSVIWSDGVLQTELALSAGGLHRIEETQRQLSSCPVLFAFDGQRFAFITDVLGVGGVGFMERPGVYSAPRPRENLLLPNDRLASKDGRYQLKITEPMEEVTYLDAVALVAYDVPPGWAMTLDERKEIGGPATTGAPRFFRRERLPTEAITDEGEDVTAAVTRADGVAAPPGSIDRRFIGRTDEHTLTVTFDRPLDNEPGDPILVLDGWIEYPYSQTVFAAWQAGALYRAPSLDARDAEGGWHTLLAEFGYPAGMPRQMSVPLGRLPRGTDALRIRTTQEVYWDRIAVAYAERLPSAIVRRLTLTSARLAITGYARRSTGPFRRPSYDYDARVPLWDARHPKGFYTAEGALEELVAREDGAVAIFGPGEEVHLEFTALDRPPAGWTRRFVLELRGWCKDMDLYTKDGDTVEPVPGPKKPSPARARLHQRFNTRYASGQ